MPLKFRDAKLEDLAVVAVRMTRDWPADSLRLDAWDGPGGAGEFYRKCGFTERGHVSYKGTPLVYFEILV